MSRYSTYTPNYQTHVIINVTSHDILMRPGLQWSRNVMIEFPVDKARKLRTIIEPKILKYLLRFSSY